MKQKDLLKISCIELQILISRELNYHRVTKVHSHRLDNQNFTKTVGRAAICSPSPRTALHWPSLPFRLRFRLFVSVEICHFSSGLLSRVHTWI